MILRMVVPVGHPDCFSVVFRDVGAMSSTAGKMAPGAAHSTSARRCKASAQPQTSSTATSNCSARTAMPSVRCVFDSRGGADPSGNLGLVPHWVIGHRYLMRPCKGETKVKGTRSLLPERVKGMNVRETAVGECGVFLE